MLTVTNDIGCEQSDTVNVDIYEVVSDFTISDTLLHCSPQDVTLTSLNNENIDRLELDYRRAATLRDYTRY